MCALTLKSQHSWKSSGRSEYLRTWLSESQHSFFTYFHPLLSLTVWVCSIRCGITGAYRYWWVVLCQVMFWLIYMDYPHQCLWGTCELSFPFCRISVARPRSQSPWRGEDLIPKPVLWTTVPCIGWGPLRNLMKPRDKSVEERKYTFSFFRDSFYWVLRLLAEWKDRYVHNSNGTPFLLWWKDVWRKKLLSSGAINLVRNNN